MHTPRDIKDYSHIETFWSQKMGRWGQMWARAFCSIKITAGSLANCADPWGLSLVRAILIKDGQRQTSCDSITFNGDTSKVYKHTFSVYLVDPKGPSRRSLSPGERWPPPTPLHLTKEATSFCEICQRCSLVSIIFISVRKLLWLYSISRCCLHVSKHNRQVGPNDHQHQLASVSQRPKMQPAVVVLTKSMVFCTRSL